jgi:glycosyltransferase involved in cell wall biosynthesis
MRVILASSSVPHIDGGGSLIVRWTAEAIRAAGHEVEEYYLPFPVHARPSLASLVGFRALPFAGSGDRLITIRWPAHLIQHENKTAWFIHHYRGLFDLWDSPYRALPPGPESVAYREAVRRIDNLGFAECRSVYVNSAIMRERVSRYNDVTAPVLFPPLGGDTSRFRTESYGDFVFYSSRVTSIKRQLLAVEAMRYTTSAVRLVVAGHSDDAAYRRRLEETVREHGLQEKVELRFGWLPETDKTDLLGRCLATVYVPVGEDSYGYTSLEASHSAKAIVTTTDAGGVLEFVRDEQEGLVVATDPRAIAAAFDRLFEDRALAQRLGEQSSARRSELDISWEHVLPRLLEDA